MAALTGSSRSKFLCFLLFISEIVVCHHNGVIASKDQTMIGKIVYAINAGGSGHVDSDGIEYQSDPCTEGIASDYGKRFWTIGRVDPDDSILYQTERYGFTTFGYTIPIKDDGDYVLVLKFSEVYFLNPRKKVFDVRLNQEHAIVKDLDIFKKVGHSIAHDELIPFKIFENGKRLQVNGEESTFNNYQLKLEFVKGALDNPKINAFYVIKGTYLDVPGLPPYEPVTDEYDDEVDEEQFLDSNEHFEDEEIHFPRFSEHDDDIDDDDAKVSGLTEAQKRRRRLIRQPPFKNIDELESDDWTSVYQVCGPILLAIFLAFVLRKIISIS